MEYTNEQLAKDYLNLMYIRKGNPAYKRTQDSIKIAPISVQDYFTKHRSFKGLKISGVSRQTLQILESLLTEGFEKMRNQYIERVEQERRGDIFTGTRMFETQKYKEKGRHVLRKELGNE